MTSPGRAARLAVLALSVLLPATELLRLSFHDASPQDWAVTALVLPVLLALHLRHVTAGLRGERPAHAMPTLIAMALLLLVLTSVVGAPVAGALGTLVCSVLLAAPLPWAGLGVVGVLLWAWATGAPSTVVLVHRDGLYLALGVLFRGGSMTVLVWLVAARARLAAQRAALVERGVAVERADLDGVLGSVRGRASSLAAATVDAHRAIASADDRRVRAAVGSVVAQARALLGEVRAVLRAWAGLDLAVAGDLLDDRSPTRAAAATAADRARAFERFVSVVHHRPLLVAAVQAPAIAIALAEAAFSLGVPPHLREPTGTLSAIMAVQLAIVLGLGFAVANGRRLGAARALALLPPANLAVALALTETAVILPMMLGALAVAAIVLAFGPAAGVAATLAYVPLDAAITLGYLDLPAGPVAATVAVVWAVGFPVVIVAVVVAASCGGPLLIRACSELVATRHLAVVTARDDERRRLARDLHDVLGHRLSALSITGELTLRLLDRDREEARARARELTDIAVGLVRDVDAVLEARESPSLHAECATARELLGHAGIGSHVALDAPAPGGDADALLAWVVRESVTNVLRHAGARHCTIATRRVGDGVVLTVADDGAGGAAGGPAGAGLHGLAERARAFGGNLTTTATARGFTLTVTVPVTVPAGRAARAGR